MDGAHVPDVFVAAPERIADRRLRRADGVKKHYRKRKLPKPKDMEKIARAWEPYRSVACWYMWRSLDIKTI